MSLHHHLWEEAERGLRQVEREMKRQMRQLDLQLQQLHEELPVPALCGPALHPCCLCQPGPSPWERRVPTVRLDVEGKQSSTQKRLNRMLNSSHDSKLLALMDVKGFNPEDVTVTVKDGKVKVLAEHEEEHTTAGGKEYNYRKITREISLPPGVSEDEVTYLLEPNSVVKIQKAPKCSPCPQSR